MRTALYGVDVVHKRQHVFVECGVVGHSHFHRNALLLCADVNHVVDERFLVMVDVTNKLVQAGFAVEAFVARIALLVALAQVGER